MRDKLDDALQRLKESRQKLLSYLTKPSNVAELEGWEYRINPAHIDKLLQPALHMLPKEKIVGLVLNRDQGAVERLEVFRI